MCESECSQVPEYEWFGSYWAMDPPMERCMMYKPGRHQNGEYGYYWLKGVCTEKYAAICEIDFKHQACHAFGMDDVSSMKWITNESYNSTHLEYQFCDSGSKQKGYCEIRTHMFHEEDGCEERAVPLTTTTTSTTTTTTTTTVPSCDSVTC